MSATSEYLDDRLLDHVFRQTLYPPPKAIWVAFFKGDPFTGKAEEVAGGNYRRVVGRFERGTPGKVRNVDEILFPPATADWGIVTHVALMDQEVGGNILYRGKVLISKETLVNDQLRFPPMGLVISLGRK